MSQFGTARGAAGRHPDADQLSAFIEQALPAHEREEVLLHLAACRDCRETVALALPEEEEVGDADLIAASRARVAVMMAPAAVAATPMAQEANAAASAPAAGSASTSTTPLSERTRVYTRWTVWAPAITAIAALGLILAYVHRTPRQALEQQAQNTPPQRQVQSSAQPQLPNRSENALQNQTANQTTSAEQKAGIAGANPIASANPPEPPPPVAAAPTLNAAAARDATALADKSVAAEAMQAPASRSGESIDAKAAGSLTQVSPGIVAQPPAPPAPATAAVAPAPALSTPSNGAGAPPPIGTNSVQVSNGSMAQMEVNAAPQVHGLAMKPAQAPPVLRIPLPSRQPAVSTAAYGNRVLAIDAKHTLFLSTDAGLHWKRITGGWQGHAMQVNLVLSGTGSEGGPRFAGASGFGDAARQGRNLDGLANNDRQRASIPLASLTGIITDISGAVIPRAMVTVTDTAGQNSRTAMTGNDGRYTVSGLATENYNLTVTAPGFAVLHLGSVAIDASRPNAANLTLQIGSATESVTVQAESVPLEADEAAKRKTIAAPADTLEPPAAFEITTDAGERWTSSDGKTWIKK